MAESDKIRVILLIGTQTYRGTPFVEAAEHIGLEAVKGLDMPKPLARQWRTTLPLDFRDPDKAVADIVAFAKASPVRAILCVDDNGAVIAARAAAELGLSHNSPDASVAARDKLIMRQRLADAGVPIPHFVHITTADDPTQIAAEIHYPVVVKPTHLSASQGVIRANTPAEFVEAFHCTRSIALATGDTLNKRQIADMLVEEYIDGFEVALEGILAEGHLKLLALFDKPDPLVGPYFEETIYVTPSRLPDATQAAILTCAADACAALGLREGPVHAELRVNEQGPWVIEVAGRSIGGLCSKTLRFGTEDISLEELILRRAVGMDVTALQRENRAGGVMMIPIPAAGILKNVEGVEDALSVPGIEEVDITLPLQHPVVPLPEGASYLGFIFARGETPDEVETALREAHRRLHFTIVPNLRLMA
ncbi:MAG: ATP-grasp domain-containing protein [Anaerolineae bacterium]